LLESNVSEFVCSEGLVHDAIKSISATAPMYFTIIIDLIFHEFLASFKAIKIKWEICYYLNEELVRHALVKKISKIESKSQH
jgi:hypothetical protein